MAAAKVIEGVRAAGAGLPDPVVALPFLWRRMRASLRPRLGAAPVARGVEDRAFVMAIGETRGF